jgi:proteasome assembly chaperone (PAC2) family protein
MQCIDCRTSMIGSLPDHLYNARRCKKCFKIYAAQMELEAEANNLQEELKKAEEVIKVNKELEDEEESNRFDLIDFD